MWDGPGGPHFSGRQAVANERGQRIPPSITPPDAQTEGVSCVNDDVELRLCLKLGISNVLTCGCGEEIRNMRPEDWERYRDLARNMEQFQPTAEQLRMYQD